MPIRAVTFDFWNTIAGEPARGAMREARHAAVLAACESLGLEHTAERIGTTVEEVIRGREASWAEGVHLSPAEGAERLADGLELDAEARMTVAEAFLGAGRGRGAHPPPGRRRDARAPPRRRTRARDRLRRGLHRRRDPARLPRRPGPAALLL